MIVTRLEPPLPLSMKVTKTGSSEKALCAEAVIHLGAMHRDSLRSGLPAPWGLAASEGCPNVSCSGV